MLLCVDIGNTNIVVGGFDNDDLKFEFRLTTDARRTTDDYAASLHSLFSRHLGPSYTFKYAIISSVVPNLTSDIQIVLKDLFSVESLVVGPGIKTGIAIKLTDVTSVGSDRVVNGLAVRELYGPKSVVVDFGTATTFDYVNQNGDYEGGIIAPGLKTSLESLVEKTAKLPKINLAWPERIIGKNTIHAMQSGALVGYVCMVDGIIDQVIKEVGELNHIISTGGLGELICSHSKRIMRHDSTLTLKGMKLIAALNGLK